MRLAVFPLLLLPICSAVEVISVPYVRSPKHRKYLEPLLRENLEVDLAPWKARSPLLTSSVVELFEQWGPFETPSLFRLVLIYNNTWSHVVKTQDGLRLADPPCWEPGASGVEALAAAKAEPRPSLEEGCDHQLSVIARAMRQNMHAPGRGLVLPDCLFVISVSDEPQLKDSSQIRAPTFVLFKDGIPGNQDHLIVVPQLAWTVHGQYSFPWEQKSHKAFFSGTPYCTPRSKPGDMIDVCPRKYFAYRSQTDKGDVLQVGLTMNVSGGIGPGFGEVPIQRTPPLPIREHARYKYLLHFEGFSGSSRLGQLLHINSLVLRAMESNWTEYFYRSLVPQKHYIPFWQKHRDDLFEALDEVKQWDKSSPGKIKGIILAAKHFAAQYTTLRAKLFYYQAAITKYKALFPDMDAFIASELLPKIQQQKFL